MRLTPDHDTNIAYEPSAYRVVILLRCGMFRIIHMEYQLYSHHLIVKVIILYISARGLVIYDCKTITKTILQKRTETSMIPATFRDPKWRIPPPTCTQQIYKDCNALSWYQLLWRRWHYCQSAQVYHLQVNASRTNVLIFCNKELVIITLYWTSVSQKSAFIQPALISTQFLFGQRTIAHGQPSSRSKPAFYGCHILL